MFKFIEPDWNLKNITAFTTLATNVSKKNPFGDFNLATHVEDDFKKVSLNRKILNSYLPSKPFWLTQNHSNKVINLKKKNNNVADASFSKTSNICVILTADCLPILVTDKNNSFVAAIHAGWRGLLNNIITNTLNAINSTDYLIWLGPAIGPDNFQVGFEVYNAFIKKKSYYKQAFARFQHKYTANIYDLAKIELENFKIKKIYGGNFCTYSDERFYSFRKNNITGRMASLIFKKN